MRNLKPFNIAIIFLLFGILQCSLAFADCSTKICVGLIERILMDSEGTAWIATDGDERSLNCSADSGVYVTMTTASPVFKEQYALLLTAQSLGQVVGLRIIEGSENCAVSYIYLDAPK
ncbi:MAG: hypothetical protein COA36_07895 [Desulfotalea sp.]|nr:MAG: hypothetical protein COA36_07895 [Desulfotalea sp.]